MFLEPVLFDAKRRILIMNTGVNAPAQMLKNWLFYIPLGIMLGADAA